MLLLIHDLRRCCHRCVHTCIQTAALTCNQLPNTPNTSRTSYISGTTIGFPDVFGHAAPDKLLLIAVDRPSAISVSTCNGNTDFDAFLWLYDGLPHNGTLVADSTDSTDCAVVFAEVPGPSAYYLVVDGATPDAMGYFEVRWLNNTLTFEFAICSQPIPPLKRIHCAGDGLVRTHSHCGVRGVVPIPLP